MFGSRKPVRWVARNGTPLLMRLARNSDTPQVKVSLDKLSPEARRNRFFSPIPGFSDELVRKLTVVDRSREHVVFVLRQEGGKQFPVAGGRFVVTEDHWTRHGEFSLVVGDAWQGEGIGRRVMQELIDEASRRGLAYLYGDVLVGNENMLGLARALGFRVEPGSDGTLRRVVLDVPQRRAGVLGRLLSGWSVG
jgi:acetyltransferase